MTASQKTTPELAEPVGCGLVVLDGRVVRRGESRSEAQRLRAEVWRAEAGRDCLDRGHQLGSAPALAEPYGCLDRLDDGELDRLVGLTCTACDLGCLGAETECVCEPSLGSRDRGCRGVVAGLVLEVR